MREGAPSCGVTSKATTSAALLMVLLNTSYTHTRSMLRGAPAVSVVLVVSSCVALICQVVVVTVRGAPVPRGKPCSHWL